MKSESPFFNPDLTKQMNRFSAVAEVRFSLLDKFNKDCKALTKMLEKYAVPELDWVWVEPDNTEVYCGLGWHNGTIVWACNNGMAKFSVEEGEPIYEASADIRSWLAEHNVLPLLFQDACLALEELAEKMRKPKKAQLVVTEVCANCDGEGSGENGDACMQCSGKGSVDYSPVE